MSPRNFCPEALLPPHKVNNSYHVQYEYGNFSHWSDMFKFSSSSFKRPLH
ncbi:hypothetical protein EXN66_Car003361 [Channa argus]|uniref:Uncharacterized protein n=1 Tax=Channa argus TaxID=215402 RepID=A0A6G1PBV3_CHAAH|nr:hypothetical protein EXN66_Car003361 [Channa argus]